MAEEPRFVPAVVVAPSRDIESSASRRVGTVEHTAGTMEVEINGVTVCIGPGSPADTIAAVMRALKAGA